MDIGEKIRLKVKEEVFVDTSPAGPTVGNTSDANTLVETKRKIPYMIKVWDFDNWFSDLMFNCLDNCRER